MKHLLIIILALVCINVKAQSGKAEVGKPAALISFQATIDIPLKPDFYKGKILVLDFWATWCAPCIANFPHFNQLAKTYQGKDIIFATITDDPLKTVRAFFVRTKKPLEGFKLIDTSEATFKDFSVNNIPYCVVIDKNNIIRWIGPGQGLNTEILEAVIKGKTPVAMAPIAEPVKSVIPANTALLATPNLSFSLTLSKGGSGSGGSRTNASGDYITLSKSNTVVGNLLEEISGLSRGSHIMTNDTAKLNQLITLKFDSKADTLLFKKYAGMYIPKSPRKNMIMYFMGDALKYNLKIIKKTEKHYKLIVTDSIQLHKFASVPDAQVTHSSLADNEPAHVEIVGYFLKDITTIMETGTKTIIDDNIDDKRKYDLSLDFTSIANLQKTLRFHGLDLKEVDGEVQLMNVEFY